MMLNARQHQNIENQKCKTRGQNLFFINLVGTLFARDLVPFYSAIDTSDQGSQYCAHDYQNLLQQFGMIASMSRKGNCYDNAPMESFWGILKTELVHHRRFKTRQQAIAEITEYIEIFYNRQRKQEKLGYLSPAQFLKQYYANLLAA